jgi:hypothetical protein
MLCDELPDKSDLLAADALAPVHRHGSSVPEIVSERK